MKFRPCIDIHDGKVKQIVGGSLDDNLGADTNYVSEYGAEFYGRLYRTCNLPGGHIILLNKPGSREYIEDMRAAGKAISQFPGGFMVGGGVTPQNASEYIRLGASHVIVTSYVFRDGIIDFDRLEEMKNEVGREHLVLDLSCRKKAGDESGLYYVVTDRWQNYTDTALTHETMDMLSDYADEYLIHAVDVEGKKGGIDKELIELLGSWQGDRAITYAGGVASFKDLDIIKELGKNRVDVTIGSALSIFGGNMDFHQVIEYME
ncbi:MAG: phosphoribosylformimino-5-aminoimidazole carboxamide ribotide isomerase [Eubacterium sp.]|nr:phosphoribosylformimino-5-aminoimidazole carboxamide ribotide isomerase [Eubacterium sp.]